MREDSKGMGSWKVLKERVKRMLRLNKEKEMGEEGGGGGAQEEQKLNKMGEAGLMNLRKGRRGCGNDWGGVWGGGEG